MNNKTLVVAGCIRPGVMALSIHPDFGCDDDWVAVVHDASENTELEGLVFLWSMSDEMTSMWDEDTDEYAEDIADRQYWARGEW